MPVSPTSPSFSPFFTAAPEDTEIRPQWAYRVVQPLAWVTVQYFP